MGKTKEGWEGEEGQEVEAEGEGNRNHQRFAIQDLPSLHFGRLGHRNLYCNRK